VCQEKRSSTQAACSLHLIFIIQCIYVRKFVDFSWPIAQLTREKLINCHTIEIAGEQFRANRLTLSYPHTCMRAHLHCFTLWFCCIHIVTESDCGFVSEHRQTADLCIINKKAQTGTPGKNIKEHGLGQWPESLALGGCCLNYVNTKQMHWNWVTNSD
jgi:hypothetical protein